MRSRREPRFNTVQPCPRIAALHTHMRAAVGAAWLSSGRFAEVIGVDGNPLQDLRMQQVTLVMKDGKVFKSPAAVIPP